MFTHALAFFISAMAYKFAKKHIDDKRFVFGTAKMGDLGHLFNVILILGKWIF
jgi:Co/Zn/Cd efflux system component